ncbi:MAG: sugar transferase [Anaerolineae bacterium]|nr:sugar transferase [Anaerolineae bacterium]
MLKRFTLKYVLVALMLDVAGVIAALRLGTYLRVMLPYGLVQFNPRFPEGLPQTAFYYIAIVLWIMVALTASLYDPRKNYKAIDEFQTLTITLGVFWLAVAGVLYFSFRDTSRVLILYAAVIDALLSLFWRVVMRVVFRVQQRRLAGETRVLIVGAGTVGCRVAEMIDTYFWAGLRLVGYLDDDPQKRLADHSVLGTLDDIQRVVQEQRVNDVVLALPPDAHERLNLVVSRLHELPVNVRIIPDYFSLALYRATVEDFGGIPMINLRDPALNDYQRLVKRMFDLVAGTFVTLLALPLMVVVALAIKLDSPGPAIFRQKRVGENGRLFDMFKFRSMIVNAETLQEQVMQVDEEGHLVHKVKDDPRVTRVGRFIRRWSLDELPQFFNVLKGDISLVGPRPELPWLVDEYAPWQRKRFAVPQGVTGWWQVNGRSDKTMHLHTDEDLYYIQNYSLWLDIFILIKTPWAILRGKGAY